ncbi:type IV pilus modification PilV family protein [Frigoriglobus tundricola]|uniref:Prepilin-type N-terminal cleavage/methylation domain-containing protein n=1 Tax=Frigoriglobus tundricola TaxID=2774151 RepID=A0A6M5YTK4_9BACT|nr:prepilin-type N-terminal cleavage/methylation domain-containing protein [Frigoriglobus tundricola]QJW97189.1 hypothetical protein FTUN_4754 [Frigoriglobus tundricola]
MTRCRPARTARPGLSLIEVILALAILVLATTAISRLFDIGTDRGTEARVYSRGARLAQSKMAEAEAGLISPLSGGANGQFDGDDAAWTYSVTAEGAGPTNLYTVTVTVSRDVRGKPLQVSLTQMVFDPALIGSSAQAETPDASSVITAGTSTIDGVSSSSMGASSTGGASP